MIKNYLKIFVALVFATNVMAQNIPSYVPKDGLVGWWPFNGNANDESGNGNHGMVNGAMLTTDRYGKVNSAYSFGGSKKSSIDIKSTLNYADFSFSFWYFATDTTNNSLIDWRNISNDKPLLNFTFDKFGSLLSRLRDDSNYNEINLITKFITANKWNLITFTFSKGVMNIYLNGVLNNTNLYTQSKWSLNYLQLGNNYYDQSWFYSGKLDDISTYNRALTDQEVKQLYEGCTKETATSSNFNSVVYTTNASLNLKATPAEGTFSGVAVENNSFNPSKGKLGKNQVKYTFKNSTGCADSTNFEMILVDTLGNKCTETIYDTIKVKESTYDTLKIKIQLTTGIKAGQLASMNVFPNPTSDVLIIEASDVAALNGYSYKMVDLQGKQVYKELVTKSKTEISLKSIGAKGVYILHVLDAQGVSIENKKIVLE